MEILNYSLTEWLRRGSSITVGNIFRTIVLVLCVWCYTTFRPVSSPAVFRWLMVSWWKVLSLVVLSRTSDMVGCHLSFIEAFFEDSACTRIRTCNLWIRSLACWPLHYRGWLTPELRTSSYLSPRDVFRGLPLRIGSHMGLMSALGLLMGLLANAICAASLIFLIFQCGSLSMMVVSFHCGWWSPSDHTCSAIPDFRVSPWMVAFLCSSSLTDRGRPVYSGGSTLGQNGQLPPLNGKPLGKHIFLPPLKTTTWILKNMVFEKKMWNKWRTRRLSYSWY